VQVGNGLKYLERHPVVGFYGGGGGGDDYLSVSVASGMGISRTKDYQLLKE
jgi:hypothetical protein